MAIFTAFSRSVPRSHVVHDAARRADDDLRALPQAQELAVVGLAAIDRQRMNAALEQRQLVDFLRDLHRQFARRAKDEHLRLAFLRIHLFNRGHRKRRGLAGAGLRLAHDVTALLEYGNGLGLNGRGLFKAEFVDGLQQFGGKAQFGK